VDLKEKEGYRKKLEDVFRPGAPIDKYELFSGRQDQVLEVYNTVNQTGRHVILFGERGVGKTSLAQVISEILDNAGIHVLDSGTINCDGTDDFSSLWHKTFREMSIAIANQKAGKAGFVHQLSLKTSLDEMLPDVVTPDDVRYALTNLSEASLIILDEVDRLRNKEAMTLLADTIKNLSDHRVNTTLVLVGVADNVDELISEHKSIERALVQVRMPRMTKNELREIIDAGVKAAGMTIKTKAKETIVHLSQGLPFYTHYFGLYSAFKALSSDRTEIEFDDVTGSIVRIIDKAHNIRSAYHQATNSPQKNNLFGEVLLSCALTNTDELGYFAAGDISFPLSAIMKKKYEIPNYAKHLKEFCTERRGPILQKIGEARRIRYRFVDPLMQPFVILEGLNKNRFDIEEIFGPTAEIDETKNHIM
jgi:Cdc6-like AAA superfamily ATPase